MPTTGRDGGTLNGLLLRSLAILSIVTIVTAYFSETFYFPDEQFQVLEFMSYKLGITAAIDLRWEFAAHIRPFAQPLLYTLIAKPLIFAGVDDLFVIIFILRLLTGLLSLFALAVFSRAILDTIEGQEEKLAFLTLSPIVWVPALSLRAHLVRNDVGRIFRNRFCPGRS